MGNLRFKRQNIIFNGFRKRQALLVVNSLQQNLSSAVFVGLLISRATNFAVAST